MEKNINDNQMQVREVAVTVDGIPFDIYFMEYDVTEDVLKLYFYATDENVEKNFASIFKRFEKMMRQGKEAVVELYVGDFKKNVTMRGTSSSGRFYYEGEVDTELEEHKGIIHCTLKFSLEEDDYSYLIDKYYPERTHPSTESQKEKYGDSELAIDEWNEFLEMKKRYYKE